MGNAYLNSKHESRRVSAALKVVRQNTKTEVKRMEDMKPQIVEHGELKLIGIPCVSLKDMSGKYHHAKEGLLSSTKHFSFVKNPSVHYGIWPEAPSQGESDLHAYILCVEVDTFDGVPEWYFKTTLPPQKCVVVPNKSGDYDAACCVVDQFVADNDLDVDAKERKYIICERYNYEGEGFAKYSLPIQPKAEEGLKSSSPIKNEVGSVFVPVRDIEKSRVWYCRILGLEEADCEIISGHLCPLPMQGTGIILDTMPKWGGAEPGGAPSIETPAFMLMTEDLQGSLEYMKGLGVELVTEIEHDHWFVVKDPDGNKLMICRK